MRPNVETVRVNVVEQLLVNPLHRLERRDDGVRIDGLGNERVHPRVRADIDDRASARAERHPHPQRLPFVVPVQTSPEQLVLELVPEVEHPEPAFGFRDLDGKDAMEMQVAVQAWRHWQAPESHEHFTLARNRGVQRSYNA